MATLTHLSRASVTKRIRVVITLAPGVEVDVGAVVGVGAGRERRNASPELVGESNRCHPHSDIINKKSFRNGTAHFLNYSRTMFLGLNQV
jgi:hypothetical protein